MTQVQLKLTEDSIVFSHRRYDILNDGVVVGKFYRSNGRWTAHISRDPTREYQQSAPCVQYASKQYHNIIRALAYYVEGDIQRADYAARGVWTNPSPVPEIIGMDG
jgi:hypothetical protein